MSRKIRLIAVVLILTLGAAGAVSAFPLTPRPVAVERSGLVARVLDWLGSVVTPSRPGLTSMWAEEGSQLDPDG
jgi:hypothetical protein